MKKLLYNKELQKLSLFLIIGVFFLQSLNAQEFDPNNNNDPNAAYNNYPNADQKAYPSDVIPPRRGMRPKVSPIQPLPPINNPYQNTSSEKTVIIDNQTPLALEAVFNNKTLGQKQFPLRPKNRTNIKLIDDDLGYTDLPLWTITIGYAIGNQISTLLWPQYLEKLKTALVIKITITLDSKGRIESSISK